MPFAKAVYERLRETDFEQTPWPGFGVWAAREMEANRLRWDGA